MVSATNFRDISDKFLQSEASIIQLSNSFTQLADEVKLRCDFSKDEDRAADVKILLSCINKFLQCIIEYAQGGVANTRSSNLHQLCNKICKAVEDLKIKDEFLEHLSISTFEFLFGEPTWIAKEILRMYNTAIQNTDINVRSRVINMKGSYYLGRLMDELPFGDIDFQLIIVETLIRLSTKEAMKDMPTVNFQREEHREAFYNIDTNKFDFTARIFLNVLNETENHVVSLLCNRVTFDDYLLQEPHELASFQGLWVDFNVKAGSVTLFINNEVFNKNSGWEMITIFSENIAKNDVSYMFNEESKKREGVAKILLKGPCQMIYAAAQHQLHNCRLLTLHSLDTEKFKEVFNQAFPKIHKRIKQKQARSLSFKKAYKPLDIVSVKSSATIPSTTFNATMDSSTAGRKQKCRRLTTGYMDQTTMSTISSRKSLMNISVNDSISLKLDDSVDLSLINYKIKKTNENIMKRHSNSHDMSSCSNLSVLEQIKTGKDAEIAVASKKMRLSNIEKVEINDKFKTTRFSKYSQEFLSSLIDIEENENAIGGYGATNSNFQKNNNATTLMGGLYSTNLLKKDDESITSDVFHSIENIDSEHKGKKGQKRSGVKKLKTHSEKKLSLKAFESNKVKITSRTIIEQKADINNGKTEVEREPNRISSLGIHLSPDLFSSPSQSSVNVTNQGNISESVNKSKTKRSNQKKVAFAFREITNLSLIDRDRDCQIDEFDLLKLERPKNLHIESQNDEVSTEPSLIQISKSKYPATETEMFETARTQLDHEEASEIELTDKKFELFQDVSQNIECSAGSSQGHSSETNIKLCEEYKSKIKILSDIQIHSPILKPFLRKEGTQITQDENNVLKSKESTKSSKKTHDVLFPERHNSSHLARVPSTVEKSQEIEERHSRIVTPTIDEDLELNSSKVEMDENSGDKLSQYSETQSLVLQEEFERFQDVSQNIECSAGRSSQSSKEKCSTLIKILSDVKIHSPISKSNLKNEGEISQDKDVIPSPDEEMEVLASKSPHSIDQLEEWPQSEKEVNFKKSIGTTYSKSENESEEKNLNECDIEEQKISQNLKLSDNAEIGSVKEESKVKKKRKKRILLTAPNPKKNKKNKQEKRTKTLKVEDEKMLEIAEDEDNLPLSKLKQGSGGSQNVNNEVSGSRLNIMAMDEGVICSTGRNDALDSNLSSEKNVKIDKKDENIFSNSPKNQSNSQCNSYKPDSNPLMSDEVKLKKSIGTTYSKSENEPKEENLNECDIEEQKSNQNLKLSDNAEIGSVKEESKVKKKRKKRTLLTAPNQKKNKENKQEKLIKTLKVEVDKMLEIVGDEDNLPLSKLKQGSGGSQNVNKEDVSRKNIMAMNKDFICSTDERNDALDSNLSSEKNVKIDKKDENIFSNSQKNQSNSQRNTYKPDANPSQGLTNNAVQLLEAVETAQGIKSQRSPTQKSTIIKEKILNAIKQREEEVKLESPSNRKSIEKNLHKRNLEENKTNQSLKLDNTEINSRGDMSEVKKSKIKQPSKIQKNMSKDKKLKPLKKILEPMVEIGKKRPIVEETNKANYISEDEDNLPLSKLKQGSSGLKNVIKKDPSLGENQILIDKEVFLPSDIGSYPLQSNSSSEKRVEIEEKTDDKGKKELNSFRHDEIVNCELESLNAVGTVFQRSPKEKAAETIKQENKLANITKATYKENDKESLSLKQMPKKTIDKEIEKSNAQETDEIEKSLALLFDTDESQPAEPVFSKPSKIQAEADKNMNVTLNTTNSMISSNVGMLKRGRKLYNQDDERENFMNFTIAQGEIENTVNVQKPKELKILNSNPTHEKRKTDNIKKPKELRSVLEDHGKTKLEKSIKQRNADKRDKTKLDKIKNTWNENGLKGNSTKRKSTRKERLDAFYDRVIAKLQTPRNQSRSSNSVIPKVRNEDKEKYKLDFSWVQEIIRNKEKTVDPNLNFPNTQNTHREIFTQPSTSRDKGVGNVILENQDGEYDDDEIKSFMKCVVDLCQKLAKGTLTKPSPIMKKHLIATATYWMDIMKNPS